MAHHSSQTPVRIRMVTHRYEVAESIFERILAAATGWQEGAELPPVPVSPEEEALMGISRDDDEEAYSVRPAHPHGNEKAPSEEPEALELYTEGLLIYSPDGTEAQVSLAYDESELTEMDGAHSVLTYHTSEPDLLHLIRSGGITTAMTFKPRHRAVCVYETPYMPFHVGIHCLYVENKLLDSGRLLLDYIVEIRGAQAERCRMELTLL